jgi:hypothetical protein
VSKAQAANGACWLVVYFTELSNMTGVPNIYAAMVLVVATATTAA